MESAANPSASPDEPASLSPTETGTLTRRLHRGDEAAFTQFHARYFDRIYQFALLLSRGDEHEARAIVQDTFLRVARHSRVFDDETAFWNWLKAIARNAARDGGRKRQRYLSLLQRFTFQWAEPAHQTNGQAEEASLHVLLEESLGELEPAERDLMRAKYLDGASVKQLSAEVGLTPKAVESRLSRLRQSLREAVLKKLRDRKANP